MVMTVLYLSIREAQIEEDNHEMSGDYALQNRVHHMQ